MADLPGIRLSIDAGQSGSRLRLRAADGQIVESSSDPVYTDRPVVDQIAAIARTEIAACGEQVAEICAGVSGLTPHGTDAAGLRAATGVQRVWLAHDSTTAFLAANGVAPGVVVAAGTGVVTLGVVDTVARVDGWGYLVGDAGSAYWIGRAGLDEALRGYDGRSAPTVLTALAAARFGPLDELYIALQARGDRVSAVASFASDVADAAEGADHAALGIVARAGEELATGVAAAAERASSSAYALRVSWVGAVLTNNGRLRAHFTDAVRRRLPDADIAAPLGPTLDGVQMLPEVPAGHPLAQVIWRC